MHIYIYTEIYIFLIYLNSHFSIFRTHLFFSPFFPCCSRNLCVAWVLYPNTSGMYVDMYICMYGEAMKGARDAIKSSFHHWRASGCLTAKSPMIVGWGDFVDGSTNRMQPSASRASRIYPKGQCNCLTYIGNYLEQQKLLREIKFPSLLTYPKTNEVNAYIIHQIEAIPQIFRSAWNPRSLVERSFRSVPGVSTFSPPVGCFRGKLSGFLERLFLGGGFNHF